MLKDKAIELKDKAIDAQLFRDRRRRILVFWVSVYYAFFANIGAFSAILRAGRATEDSGGMGTLLMLPAYSVVLILAASNYREYKKYILAVGICMPFFAAALVSSLWSVEKDATILQSGRLFFQLLMSTSLVLALGLERFVSTLFKSILIASFLSWALYFVDRNLAIDNIQEFCGLFQTKNIFGITLACGIAALVADTIRATRLRDSKINWTFRVGAFLFLLGTLFFTHSGTSILATLVSFIFFGLYLLIIQNHLNFLKPFAVISAFLVLIVFALMYDSIYQLTLNSLGKDASLTGRTELWETGISFIRTKQLTGYGYQILYARSGVYAEYMLNNIGPYALQFHNSWINIMFQLGLIGVILNVGLYLSYVLVVFFSRKFFALSCFVGGYATLSFIQSFSEGNFLVPRTLDSFVMFGILAGWAISGGTQSAKLQAFKSLILRIKEQRALAMRRQKHS